MSIPEASTAPTAPRGPAPGTRAEILAARGSTGSGRLGAWRWVIVAIGAFALISLVRTLTGADNLTSEGAVETAIKGAMPIAMAGLAGIWSERAGIVNIGLEGMMVLGTFGCGWAGYQWGPWVGVIVGILCGALGGLLHALATVTFGVDHIISGVAITIVAPGLTLYLSQQLFANVPGGGMQQSPPVNDVYRITIPGWSTWMDNLNHKHIFFVSDLAGVLGGSTTQLSSLTVIGVILVVVTGFVLWRTRFGLRLRSTGEAPYAAETLGVNVIRFKYAAVIVSGAIAGFAGSFLVVGLNFVNGQTGGRGYIGLASVIFGNWRPGGMVLGAVLFGYTDGIGQYDSSGSAMHAVLLLLAIALALTAFAQWRAGARTVAIVSVLLAAATLLWFFTTTAVPQQLIYTAPYAITLLVMGLASQRLRPPRADGQPYRKGSH